MNIGPHVCDGFRLYGGEGPIFLDAVLQVEDDRKAMMGCEVDFLPVELDSYRASCFSREERGQHVVPLGIALIAEPAARELKFHSNFAHRNFECLCDAFLYLKSTLRGLPSC